VPFRDRTEGSFFHSSEGLSMSERRFRRLFADAPAGMLLINRNRLIVDANDALCSIARAELSEIVGRDFIEFVPRHFRDQFREHLADVFRTGRHQAVERPLRRVDGRSSRRRISWSSTCRTSPRPAACASSSRRGMHSSSRPTG
jgi:PAS domain S-box-containing protein